jgi:hypothetical protein
MLSLRMEQPGDGRSAEVHLDFNDRVALIKALQDIQRVRR